MKDFIITHKRLADIKPGEIWGPGTAKVTRDVRGGIGVALDGFKLASLDGQAIAAVLSEDAAKANVNFPLLDALGLEVSTLEYTPGAE